MVSSFCLKKRVPKLLFFQTTHLRTLQDYLLEVLMTTDRYQSQGTELTLLTGERAGKVEKAFPTFI